jgi:hypothetical protein
MNDPRYAQALPPPRPRSSALMVGLIVALVVIVAGAATAAAILISRGGHADTGPTPTTTATSTDRYSVGTCVVQQGSSALVADCHTAGAYRITKIVTDGNACDATQPSVVIPTSLGTRVACLTPAG